MALAGLLLPSVALSQDMIEELKEEFTPDCLISDDYVPDIIGDTEFVQSGRDSGVFCQPVAEEEFEPAPEGLEPWDPHGIIAENEANDALVEDMMAHDDRNSLFSFDVDELLPASRFASDEEDEHEQDLYGNDFGMEDPIFDQPVRYDPSLENEPDEQVIDFDAEMASARPNQPSSSLRDPFTRPSNPDQSGPVELGDIREARRQIALTEARDRFYAENSRIESECACVGSSSCFSAPSYDYPELNNTVATAQADFNAQQSNVCSRYDNWASSVNVEQLDTVTEIDSVLGIARTVTNDLNSLDDANSRVLADMRSTQEQIAAEIRAEEQRRQQALAQQQAAQNSGPSGWQVFGQVLQQVGAEYGDIYAEVGGSFIQDVASGGTTSALASTYNKYNTGSYDYGYDISSSDIFNTGNTGFSGYSGYSGGGIGSGSLSLSCQQGNVCVDYTFSSSSDRDNFAQQCSSIVSGSCPTSGPSCYQTAGGRSSTTYQYGGDLANFQQSCQASGGTLGGQQNLASAYGAPNTLGSAGASGGGPGQHGIALYATDKQTNWVYILSSQQSSNHAYANAYQNCGSVCDGRVLHVEFGPGQCIAFVGGQDNNGYFQRTYKISSSSSGAQNAALNSCQSDFQDRIRRGEDLEYSCNVVDSACN